MSIFHFQICVPCTNLCDNFEIRVRIRRTVDFYIFKSFLHGNKVKPFIVNEFNSDIDDIEDYLKVKKHAEKK